MKKFSLNKKGEPFLGKSFLTVPRLMLNWWLSTDHALHNYATVYLALLTQSYYADGYGMLQKVTKPCKKGELYTNVRKLSEQTRIPRSTVSDILHAQEADHLISIQPTPYGSKITVLNYDQITHTQPGKKTSPKDKINEELANMSYADALRLKINLALWNKNQRR